MEQQQNSCFDSIPLPVASNIRVIVLMIVANKVFIVFKMEFSRTFDATTSVNNNRSLIPKSPAMTANLTTFYGFIFIAVFSFVVNSIVFCCVLLRYTERRRKRPVLLLIAHMAFLAALVPFLNCFATSDKVQIIPFYQSHCQLISYSKSKPCSQKLLIVCQLFRVKFLVIFSCCALCIHIQHATYRVRAAGLISP